MLILLERRLLKIRCLYDPGMDCYVFSSGSKSKSVRHIPDEALARIFKKTQMKDEETNPRSSRGKTYLQMVTAIKDGTDKNNYIWSTHEEIFFKELEDYGKNNI